MTEAEFDTPLDFAGPGKVGCLGLGTAAVVVLDETVSIVDFLHNSCRFFAHESCGQCTPCREGTAWSLTMLNRIKAGKGRLKDLDLLLEIGDSIGIMPGTTICGLADGAAWPIKNAIRKFRGEFEEYIKRTNPEWLPGDRSRPGPAGVGGPLAWQTRPREASESSMATVLVDGKEVELAPGERLNGIQAAERAGIDIPRYCWHPGLSVVASCRMCLVETGTRDPNTGAITMLPKLVPACQTPAVANTVFVTNSEKVERSRAMVEEDLLINHPIDCPICDKAGECYAARLSLSIRAKRAAGRHSPLHQPPPRNGRHGHAVRRSLRDVHPLRPLHARDQRHQRADGHQPRVTTKRSTSFPAIRWTTRCRATSSICAPWARWATRTFCISSASGS